MAKKESIVFVAPFQSSFIRLDIQELSSIYNVYSPKYNWKNKILVPYFIFLQCAYFLFNTRGKKAIICSFAGYWSLIPILFGRAFNVPSYVIVHGTDAASIPSINYGSLRKPLLKWFIKKSYENATKILPVSDSLVKTENQFYFDKGNPESKQGILQFFPHLKTPIEVISNGLDINFWKPENEKEKNSFLAVFSQSQFFLKGGDIIVEAAKSLPHCKFHFIGLDKPENLKNPPQNVVFHGIKSPEELKKAYQKSQFYFQLSIYEGFGCALCEAMLCGCVPIGSSSNIIPEIIGSSGFILENRNSMMLTEILKKIIELEDFDNLGSLGRQRVVENYSIQKRITSLLKILDT